MTEDSNLIESSVEITDFIEELSDEALDQRTDDGVKFFCSNVFCFR